MYEGIEYIKSLIKAIYIMLKFVHFTSRTKQIGLRAVVEVDMQGGKLSQAEQAGWYRLHEILKEIMRHIILHVVHVDWPTLYEEL